MKEALLYRAPELCLCALESQYLVAASPTGEAYDDPVDYGGF